MTKIKARSYRFSKVHHDGGRGTILVRKSNHDPGNAFEMRLDNRDDKTKRVERERQTDNESEIEWKKKVQSLWKSMRKSWVNLLRANWMINLDGSTRTSRSIELRLVERIALRSTTKKLAENLSSPLLSFSLFFEIY